MIGDPRMATVRTNLSVSPRKNGTPMRTYAVAIGCIVIGFVSAFQGVPAAHADEDSFVRAVQAIGFPFAPTNLLSIAQSACNMLSYNNRPTDEIEARILRYTRVEPEQAHQFFVLAVNEFCPQYSGVVGL